MLIKNKKGDFFQIFFLLIILLVAAVMGLLCLKLGTLINEKIEEVYPDQSEAVVKVNNFVQTQAPKAVDYMVFFLFLGGTIGIMTAAVRTNFSPVIIFLFLLMSLIAILSASGIVNLYQGFAQTDVLVDVSQELTLTNIVFSRYTPLFICIIAGISLILMYSKSGSDIQI